MKNVNRFLFKPSTIALLSVLLFAAGIWLRGQAVQAQSAPQVVNVGGVQITGLPDDWTHHHLVFSNPGTEEEATQAEATQHGRHEKWSKTVNDPRYIIQQLKRRASAQGPAASAVAQLERLRTIGTAAAAGRAKDAGITAGPLLWQALRKPWRALDRENPRALAIAGLQLAILALGLVLTAASFRRRQWAPTLLLMLSTAVFVSLTSCGGVSTSDSGGAASGQLIDNDWQMNLGSGTVGAGNFPAKYSFSTTAAGLCSNSGTPDYVVYNTGVAGTTGQANIVAYDNIYSGCSGTSPLVYWSYYTGTGTVATSPVLSLDGTKVAFIESGNPSGSSTLRILKWTAGNGTDYSGPYDITTADNPFSSYANTYAGAAGNTAWSSCTSFPCMISVAFQTQLNPDTKSSPWYDYASDTLYVGDSNGYLHQFTGVFNGTPGESTNHASPGTCGTGCKWPVLAQTTGSVLTSPVVDDSRSLIFVGTSKGYLQSVNSSSGAVGTSALQDGGGLGFVDAPLLDPSPSAGVVYGFDDFCSSDTKACVLQFTETPFALTGHQGFGNTSTSIPIYAGSFDNAYYTASTVGTGTLWACGNAGGGPILYHVAVTATALLSGAVAGPTVSNATTPCSPVTEFCTNSGAACSSGTDTSGSQHDYVFVSPQTQSATAVSPCTASKGCVLSYTITSTAPAATLSGGGPFTGGASGMIVDTQNTTVGGTLQIYFGLLGSQSCTGAGGSGTGTGGCGIQASLSAP